VTVDLLSDKSYIPPIRPNLLPRPHLFEPLGFSPAKRIVLVSAPAGYGKTTLVNSWLGESHSPAAWISLDEGDNDRVRFLQYLSNALGSTIPTLEQEQSGILQALSPEALVNPIFSALGRQMAPFTLVLDDFHVIHAQPVLDLVTTLVERMPPPLRLILLSRTDPPLPLARWRARGQLVEVRASDLRLTKNQVALFLNGVMHMGLADDDIAALEERTEGWIAGLQLAALSMQGRSDRHAFVTAFTGSHHYIMDYLLDEVLKREPEPVRTFLLETSILARLCGPLCEAVLGASPDRVDGQAMRLDGQAMRLDGQAMRLDGQAMLQELEQRNLFLVPLDDERHWFRYHHLFADVLNRHLNRFLPNEVRELNRRASEWYERNGFVSDAVQHAFQAEDQERAVRLIEQNGCLLLTAGQVVTLNGWLASVASYVPTHPWLGILKGWGLTLMGQQEQVPRILDNAERLLSGLAPALESTTEVRIMRGALAAARAHRASAMGDPVAADLAGQALGYLPDGDSLSDSLKSVASLILADTCRMSGHLDQAKRAYDQAVQIGRAAGNPHLVILGNAGLADILVDEGRLGLAASRLSEALAVATRADGSRSSWVDRVLALLSRVAYARNELDTAARYAGECIELCDESGNFEFAAVAHVGLARLAEAQSHPDQALEELRVAEQLTREHVFSPGRSLWLRGSLAWLWLKQGNHEQVTRFLKENNVVDQAEPAIAPGREPLYLILLRLYLAQREYAAAVALSERLLLPAEAGGRTGRVIEILVLRALAFQGKGNLDQAMSSLAKAVALAESERAVRVFLDEGDAMARLLHQVQARHLGTRFVTEILAALPARSDSPTPPAQLLTEPLSARELEVLGHIAAGDSNDEIAKKLVISVKTVKRHTSNINAKLGAKNRTQAVALAGELKLME
jgi:LuxR family transcriptional regulator, maltose regulon positive regulatory protein